eukprot:6842002-Pyramimonas_sp.AAC.1
MDPGIRLPILQLQQWFQAWHIVLRQLRGIPPEQRTRHIRGPLSALLHQLLMLGWDPVRADLWHGPCSDDDGMPNYC